jgi:hypothetical protein
MYRTVYYCVGSLSVSTFVIYIYAGVPFNLGLGRARLVLYTISTWLGAVALLLLVMFARSGA